MRQIKLVVEYDGTDFSGFQLQPKKSTIQGVLENALSKFFDCPMKISSASGRTDAGVHAIEQIVCFKTKSDRDVKKIVKGINAYLPPEIAVRSAKDVRADFHARFNAKSKIYIYQVWNDPFRSPLNSRFAHHVFYKLNLLKIRRAIKFLRGRHNFKSFTSERNILKGRKSKSVDFVKTIKSIRIKKEKNLISFEFEGDGFLYHMVRNIMGFLLDVGRGKKNAESIKDALDARDNKFASTTAPAKGLYLKKVKY